MATAPLLTELADIADPAHTALLVIDMQNDFCAGDGYIARHLKKDMAACQATAEPIERLAEAARAAAVPVLWVRAHYDPEHLADPVLAKQKAMGIDEVCCAAGSWGADFFKVAPAEGEPVIDKHRYNAFFGTGLDERLRSMGVRSLVLTGVQTNVCIESTFREAFSLGYYLTIPEDCVASHTPPLHDASLMNFRFLFGTVTNSDELGDVWREAGTLAAHG